MHFKKIESIRGELSLPGDKSISHRALLFSALAQNTSKITNLSNSDDVKTTIDCLKKLGVEILESSGSVLVKGVGKNEFKPATEKIYCGNSGTTCRLLSGILAAQNFSVTLSGDDSLSERPMNRIIDPLQKMGARIDSNKGKLPLQIYPGRKLNPITYELPLPSAQVKGAILLSGLHSDETTTVIEDNANTRDHTERMLNLPVEIHDKKKITKVSSHYYPTPQEYFIPGDISTASFFIVLTLLSEDSELGLKNVSLNEIRVKFLEILKNMGANIDMQRTGESQNEPFGNITVKSSSLKNIELDTSIIPAIIDEIPILVIAGIFSDGDFKITNAKELRVKESDRINSLCSNLKLTGLNVEEYEDGFTFGGKLKDQFYTFESYGDHRIAMAFGILSSLLKSGGEVNNFECSGISNPDFLNQLNKIRVQ